MTMSQAIYDPKLDADGATIIAGRIATADPSAWMHDPGQPTHLDWGRYCAWRRTKCDPRDYADPAQRVADLNQATHEFVGEVAELGELFQEYGLDCLIDPIFRARLIDEIGDIFFCGSWALDGWGLNFLLDPAFPPPDELPPPPDMDEAMKRLAAELAAGVAPDAITFADAERADVEGAIYGLTFRMMCLSGLTCNSFKKLAFQGRGQDSGKQAVRIAAVLSYAAYVLAIAGSDIPSALARNIVKLEARYPQGYRGPGGGIRQGAGA